MDYKLPTIPFLKLQFILKAEQDCRLPYIKGSMIRGAFGHALKRTVCIHRKPTDCKDCLIRGQCVHTRLFDTFIDAPPPPMLKGILNAPPPYIIDANSHKTDFAQDEMFSFYITLLGNVWELFPYVIFAVDQLAKSGLTVKRCPFRLERVLQVSSNTHPVGPEIYRGDKQCLTERPQPSVATSGHKTHNGPVTIEFMTPTRIKFDNKYTMEFNFRLLAFKMLRRLLEIAHFYVPDSNPDWEFKDYLNPANDISIKQSSLKWWDWHRYSNRQQTKMEMGGFVGNITLDGPLNGLSQLLTTSEVLHVGKGTTFGLGKIQINECR